jgi:DNA-binding transcriptional MocR family regulator
VEAAVERGALPPGSPVPTVRSLASELDTSPSTVAAAYRSLRQRGILAGEGRRGTRVCGRPPLPTHDVAVPEGAQDLASGNPDPALLPDLAPALARLPRRAGLYGGPPHLDALLEQARGQLAADGIAWERLTVVSGALDGVERVLTAHLAPGDRVAVEDPGYTGVLDLVSAMGLLAVPVPIDDAGVLPDRLEAALRAGARAVAITPRAQNPSGAALDAPRARDLAAVLHRRPEVLVVEDDHAGAVSGAPALSLAGAGERWTVIRSTSKALGPDLRLAVVAGDATSIARMEGRQRLGAGWVSHLLQHVVADLWARRTTAAQLARATRAYTSRRRALLEALARRGIAATGRSGLNVWVPVPEEQPVVAGLLARGRAVAAGERFRVRSPPAVRITVAALEPAGAEALADDIAEVLRPSRRTRLA